MTEKELVELDDVAVWRGTIAFPAGAAARWRAAEAETIERWAARMVTVTPDGDEVAIAAIVPTARNAFEARLLGLLERAAKLGATGTVTLTLREGRTDRVTFRLARKKVVRTAASGSREQLRAALRELAPLAKRSPAPDDWAYVDRTGRVAIPFSKEPKYEFSEGLAAVGRVAFYRFMDRNGKVRAKRWHHADRFAEGLAPVAKYVGGMRNEVFGYIDARGRWKVAPEWDHAEPFQDGLGLVQRQRPGACRFVNRAGKLVGPEFDWAHPPSEGRVWIQTDEGFICLETRTGRRAFATTFAGAAPFSDGLAAVTPAGATKAGYADRTGKLVIPARFDEARPFVDGRAVVCLGGRTKHYLIDRKGRALAGPWAVVWTQPAEGLLAVEVKGKTGFVGLDGKMKIAPAFAGAGPFSGGLAGATHPRTKLAGYIDRTGAWAIEPRFDQVSPFRDGLAAVQWDGLWGYVDRSGSFVVEPIYSAVQGAFTDDRSWVKV